MKKTTLFFLLSTLCALRPTTSFAVTAAKENDPKTVIADKLIYNAKEKSIKVKGNATVTTASGQKMTLKDAYIDRDGNIAYGSNTQVMLNQRTRISAAEIQKNGNITNATDVNYTACYGCDTNINAWEISASKLKHNKETQNLYFDNPVFWAYDVPIFWVPYMVYPDPSVKHRSGLLLPYFNTTNGMGMQFNLPVYLSFSDSHDLTLTPAYLTGENPLLMVEHRLNAERSAFRTTGSYTYTKESQNRWHIFNDDVVELGQYARLNLFFHRTSDQTYLLKYGFYEDQPYLDSGGRLELFARSGYATANVHFFQELRPPTGNGLNPSGDILPNIHGVYQTRPLALNTYASFMGDMIGVSNFDTGTATQRMIGSASLTSPWVIWGGQKLTLSASARYDVYNFVDTDLINGTTGFTGVRNRFLPSAYAEWAWPLVKKTTDWTHVLEPRARITTTGVVGAPAFANIDSGGTILSDAALFADDRFAGYDLWPNGTYMDYGANWSSYYRDKIYINGFLGQTYDFQPPVDLDPNSGFHDGASDYVGRAGIEYGKTFSLYNRFRFAENNFAFRHLESVAKFGDKNYIEGGYILAVQLLDADTAGPSVSEALVGFGVNLTPRFSVRERLIYDITDSRIARNTAGIYYDHPCYTISFEINKDGAVRTNTAIGENYRGQLTFHLSFSLKLTEPQKAPAAPAPSNKE